MNIEEKKKLVIQAGIKLVETGLIARTWGNVSCRIDESSFLITPSGRNYLTLTSDEIVTVKISDCSYEGKTKPSSEKGVHAEVYQRFPNTNFVIHTHQENASAISATGISSMEVHGYGTFLSHEVICADYALPGTKKLRANIAAALKRSTGLAVIMKNHGALCFGKNYEETFLTAAELEAACMDFLVKHYMKISGEPVFEESKMYDFALSQVAGFLPIKEVGYTKQPTGVHVICQSPEVLSVSKYLKNLKPMLDDFAQIAGNNIVFSPDKGAHCYGKTKSDAEAVSLVTKKNCKAFISACLMNNVRPINPLECVLMRFVYLKKYSKQAEKSE